jgi:hypothetical protein
MAHLFQPRFWTNPAIRSWPEPDKVLALYLLTGPERSTEGLYRLRVAGVADDLGWDPETVQDCLGRLVDRGFVRWDEAAQVVLIVGVLRDLNALNPGQIRGAVNRVYALPPTSLLRDLYAEADRWAPKIAAALVERFPELGDDDSKAATPSPSVPF